MSAFGNDCHFFYNASCAKDTNCPFRHCEAAKGSETVCLFWKQNRCTKPYCAYRHSDIAPKVKNRAEIPCYWENQPVGCSKADCPFLHSRPRQVGGDTVYNDSGKVSSDDMILPVDKVILPVIINTANDSDVDMTSPVKLSSASQHKPCVQENVIEKDIHNVNAVRKKVISDHQTHGLALKPSSAKLKLSAKQKIITKADDESHVKPKVNIIREPTNDSVQRISVKQRLQGHTNEMAVVKQNRVSVKQRLHTTNKESIEVRQSAKERLDGSNPAVKERLQSGGNKPAVRERLQLGGSNPAVKERLQSGGNKPAVKERLHLGGNRPAVKERLQLGGSSPKKLSVKDRLSVQRPVDASSDEGKVSETRHSPSESDPVDQLSNTDEGVGVKSLEQIQREKALRSMGLIELKDGTTVKIADFEKQKKDSKNDYSENSSDDNENETEDEESDNDASHEEESAIEVEVEEEEEIIEEESEEELVDPDIDIIEPEQSEEIKDSRITVHNERKSNSEIHKPSKKFIPTSSAGLEENIKKRRVILDDEEEANVTKTPVIKESLHSRLGNRVNMDKDIVISVGNTSKGNIKRRLGLKDPVGSTNEGTVKTVAGIKSRLGWSSIVSHSEEDENNSEGCESPIPKRRGWRKQKAGENKDETDSKAKSKNIKPKRKIQTDDAEEVDASSEGSSSRPDTPVDRLEDVTDGKMKRTEEDLGAKVQNAITNKWRKFNVWSTRNNDKPAAERNEELAKLGIIDIQGGKVVKMGKSGDRNTQSSSSCKTDGDQWLKESMKKLAAKRDARKERAIYVPPARKRSGTAVLPDNSASPPKKMTTVKDIDLDKDLKEEPEVKTFAQIMSAKRQRQKRAFEKQKEELNAIEKAKKIKTTVEDDIDDSNFPQESSEQTHNDKKDHSSKSEHKKHRKKWRRKSKTRNEESPGKKSLHMDAENVSEKENSQHTELESSIAFNSRPLESDMVADSISHASNQVTKHKRHSTEKLGDQDPEESSPAKRSEHLLSDSWLEFDNEDLGVEEKNEDDLLKEIDALLA